MAKKLHKPEDYSRGDLLTMAERVGLKYRSRMSKEQLYDALGLGPKAAKKSAARKNGSAAKLSSAPPAVRAGSGKPPVGLEGSEIARALATSVGSGGGRPAHKRGAYLDRGPELPAGYGDDRIVALVRDPRNIYAYWELSGGAFERAKAERGEAALAGALWALRVVRVNDGRFFDIPVNPAAGNWYVRVEPGFRYQIKVGLVLSSGAFLELAASAEVMTPPEGLSDRIDEEWMLVSEEFERLMETMVGERRRQAGSAYMLEGRRRREARKRFQKIFPWNVSSRISSGAISSGAISSRAVSSRTSPSARR
jgi:hypothetical protein